MSDPVARLRTALADRYRIERELGAGGMANVFLAEDLKHDRKVALKVLKPELAAVIGGERFVVEIKTTAALQHPHILPLFDSGTVDGFLYYVMPYIEGETLRDKLNRETQLGISEAVRITSEVADALDYAHRHGVIHRDIKPENILLHDGRPMVADFGIALALSAAAGGRMTETGMSLGTPHYMSPEQATADKDISNRSDVYSLGSVLYEMLSGEPPHMGTSAQAIIMKIVTEEAAPVSKMRKSVPPNVAAAVAKAVEKLPADRFETAKAFADALNNPGFTTHAVTAGSFAATGIQPRFMLAAAAAVTVIALGAGWMVGKRGGETGSVGPNEVVQATLTLADSVTIPAISTMRLAMSPSGQRVAFIGEKNGVVQLWVRELRDPAARAVPNTEGAFNPFFSPDGETVGFFDGGSSPSLKTVAFTGGAVRTLTSDSLPSYGGASWADDGNIYFTHAGSNIARVSASGGPVTVVARVDSSSGGVEYDFPDVLPGSKHVLVLLWKGSAAAAHVGVIELATGQYTDIAPGAVARYVAPGFLAFGTADGRVMVGRFDATTARLTSTPVPMVQSVSQESRNASVQFAVSANGSIVYEKQYGGMGGLVWITRDGTETPVMNSVAGRYSNPALSPDGSQIAVTRQDGGDTQLWMMQTATGAFTRLTSDIGTAERAVWTRDGRRVAFMATATDGVHTAFIRRADGSDNVKSVLPGKERLDEVAIDPLGRYTLFRTEGAGPGSRQLLYVENGKDSVPRTLIESRFDHYAPRLSPDGNWLAYVSEESGVPNVYVRPFPTVDSARIAISVGGGFEPTWSRNGKELFFRGPRGELFAVPVTTGTQFTHTVPKKLFANPGLMQDQYNRAFDVSLDGSRFLMAQTGGVNATELHVIFNWRAELERVVEKK